MTISSIGTPARRILTAVAFATLVGALVGVAPGLAEAAFIRFAHPQADDTIRAGEAIEVVAVSIGEAPPSDLVLEFSEASTGGWQPVEDQALRGRAIHGTYRPTAFQGGIVTFRTRSPSNPAFGLTIQVFVRY